MSSREPLARLIAAALEIAPHTFSLPNTDGRFDVFSSTGGDVFFESALIARGLECEVRHVGMHMRTAIVLAALRAGDAGEPLPTPEQLVRDVLAKAESEMNKAQN